MADIQLIRYDAMCSAIAECHKVDEVKSIRDKALALEMYAKQAKNKDAEFRAAEVRIRAERRVGELVAELRAEGRLEAHGGDRKSTSGTARLKLEDLGISYDQASTWQQLAAVPEHQFESAFRDPDVKPSTNGILMSSKSDEWNTPSEIVDLAIRVLGKIDVDPCCNDGEPNIPAKVHYRRNDNGLAHKWKGKVYMNPPYGDAVSLWVEHLVGDYRSKSVTEAIALVAARVDTKWFIKFEPYTLCFIEGRLKFGESSNSATFPSAAIYLGPNSRKFVEVFSEVGWFPNRGLNV